MSRLEIGDPVAIKDAAKEFTCAAAAPAFAAAQVAQCLVLDGGPARTERSGLDDSMAGTLDWIGATLDAAARSRVGSADAIAAAATAAVDGIGAADEDGAAQMRRATPS